ncbi:hypothetical protein HU200_041093 [Digitaria exilis]|uniref:UDP-rhamnose:rhamnosyltransferase 1 n=1 Tax=Digitaria exilis TaxID=1010633 RepID=A0A835BDI5_9POAL|nr:hypothetical protein HU200_041093 [Digitaria exilis]
MAETKQEEPPLHVVVFPWLAFGHIVPFLELAEQLARRGHLVTFVSLPRRDLSPRLRLVSLPLPAVDGLPDGAESTADVSPEKVQLLKLAFDGLAFPFASFLAKACSSAAAAGEEEEGHGGRRRKPDWIIIDFAHHWLPPIADEHEVPCALFLIFPAPFVAFMGPRSANDAHPRTSPEHFTVPPPWIPTPSSLAYRLHEAKQMAGGFRRRNASGVSDIGRFWETEQRCRLLLCRSSPEVVDDPAICDLLRDLYRKPVLPSGLLAPYDAAIAAAGDEDDDGDLMTITRWLDAQPARSVLYVAFGSEAPLGAELVREVAAGLELAGVRFLWVLREDAAAALLPDGFARRAAADGRGVVHGGWAPQVRVLAHGAVGGFMTHAGWGSLVESFVFGHRLVLLPLFGDQGLNARLMEERRVGVVVPRGAGDGAVAGDDVAETVRRVMVGPEGEVLARNAKEIQRVLWDREKQEGHPPLPPLLPSPSLLFFSPSLPLIGTAAAATGPASGSSTGGSCLCSRAARCYGYCSSLSLSARAAWTAARSAEVGRAAATALGLRFVSIWGLNLELPGIGMLCFYAGRTEEEDLAAGERDGGQVWAHCHSACLLRRAASAGHACKGKRERQRGERLRRRLNRAQSGDVDMAELESTSSSAMSLHPARAATHQVAPIHARLASSSSSSPQQQQRRGAGGREGTEQNQIEDEQAKSKMKPNRSTN